MMEEKAIGGFAIFLNFFFSFEAIKRILMSLNLGTMFQSLGNKGLDIYLFI